MDGATGVELASSGRKRIAFIPITQLKGKGATLTINGELTSGNKRIDAIVYDSNKSMVQRLTSYTETSILPLVYYEGVYYIRFVSENDNVEKMSISGNTYEFISDTNTALDLLSDQVNLSIQGKKYFELEFRVTVWEYDINKNYIGRGTTFTANTSVADTRVSS